MIISLLFLIAIILLNGCANENGEPVKPPQNDVGETVTIGKQIWMLKNLDVTTYRNGEPIPQVTDSVQWSKLTTGAWCYYNNDPATGAVFGKLYNWYAVNDPRGLAPTGWHVPTDSEWKALEIHLGMTQSQADSSGSFRGSGEGGKLKETGTVHWISPNTGATNYSGFKALPGGYRYDLGIFYDIRNLGDWWTSTEFSTTVAWHRVLYYNSAQIYRYVNFKTNGCSVRCLKD